MKIIKLKTNNQDIGTISYLREQNKFQVDISDPLYKYLLHSNNNLFEKMPGFLRLEDTSFNKKNHIKHYKLEDLSINELDWKLLCIFTEENRTIQKISLEYV